MVVASTDLCSSPIAQETRGCLEQNPHGHFAVTLSAPFAGNEEFCSIRSICDPFSAKVIREFLISRSVNPTDNFGIESASG